MAKSKSRNIIIVAIAAFIAAALISAGVFFVIRSNRTDDQPVTEGGPAVLTDAERFKQSYESLNGTSTNSGKVYHDVTISANNPIVYIDINEAIDLLSADQAIIYVGGNWCPHCRNAVPVLLSVAKAYHLDKVYYLELDDTKSLFEWQDGAVVKTRDGSPEYYKLLDALSDHLRDYTISDDAGNDQPTGEKRIYIPYVLAIKDGEIVGEHVSDVASEDLEDGQSAYDPLTTAQRDKLYGIYSDLFRAVYGDPQKDDCTEVCE